MFKYSQGKLEESVSMYKQGLWSSDRTRVPLKILNNLATVEYKLGDYISAEAHLKAALEVGTVSMTAEC